MQTADRIQNVDLVQNVDCRLQSGYKMQTENLMGFFVWYVITCNLTNYRASRDRFSAISFQDYLHYSWLFLARFLIKLDAYLRSPGLSVWNKLVFCACNCLSFYTIIGLFWNFFFLLKCNPWRIRWQYNTNVRPKENTNKNGIVRFKTDNNWRNLCGIKYFATAHPSTTKRNIVNIKQLPICRT